MVEDIDDVDKDHVQHVAAVHEEATLVGYVAVHGLYLSTLHRPPRRLALDRASELIDRVTHSGAQLCGHG